MRNSRFSLIFFALVASVCVSTMASAQWKYRGVKAVSIEQGPPVTEMPLVHGQASRDTQTIQTSESDHINKVIEGKVKLSLDDCIRLTLDRNQRLKAAGYDVEAAKGQLIEANAILWPVLEYTYRLAPVPKDVDNALNDFFSGQVTLFNSLHVGIGVPVTSFGQLQAAKKMAQGGVEAARLNQTKSKESTIYQVKQLYYGILLAKETIGLLKDAAGKITDKIKGEEDKEEKDISPYDIMQLKGFRLDLERRIGEAEANLELAYDGLRVQLDLEPGTAIQLDTNNLRPKSATLKNEREYIETALHGLPDLKLIDIGVNTKRLQYKLEKTKLYPQAGVGFFFDVGRTTGNVANVVDTGAYNDPFNFTRAGIGLQLKGTLDFHGAAGRLKKARSEYYKASFEGMVARRALELDVRKAYLTAKRAQDDLKRAQDAESVANQMMFISKMNLETGVGDEQKYGDALKYVLLTRGLYYKAVFDYNLSLSDLEQRVGKAKFGELIKKSAVNQLEELSSERGEGFYETNVNAKSSNSGGTPGYEFDINTKN